ncbi:MAG: tRNA-dihydrouridine synthase [Alphaproteobacteria bacterium]|nr:tRNA-dihydrouridine synthase [Alphaproteobacteria bacterium]
MFQPINLCGLTINTPIFAAPLAGITDRPFRRILRKCAPDAPLLTEMISCHSLIHNRNPAPNTGNKRNFDNYADEGLVGAQIFGADPKIMADAAKILEQNGASWIDINMGCPVPKVATRAGAGAFLMRDHVLAARIIEQVVKAVKIPVSIKTRLGWDGNSLDSANLVRIAANSGAKFATIHGRTRAQGYTGTADWQKCMECKLQSAVNIPIIFNGDIKNTADMATVKELFADGVMIGRALLGNPWLLGTLVNNSPNPPPDFSLVLEHLHLTLEYYGARAGVPLFRKHAAWYSAGMPGGANFRTKINQITIANELEHAVRKFFCCAI